VGGADHGPFGAHFLYAPQQELAEAASLFDLSERTARTVPLHEHLIEQGFVSFVAEMGNGPLFYVPAPPRPAGEPEPVQSPAERTRARLGDWVRSLGITDTELSPNHAWRHTFKARAERYGMSERYSDAITGHAPPTAGRAYGKPTPEDLAHAMQSFPRYSFVDDVQSEERGPLL
jgi:integrase